MYFDVIESGFNNADETINFGARNIGDSTNLYEISTIASLKSSEENAFSDIVIGGFIHDKKIFFTTHRTVRAFNDKDCNEIVFNAEFDDIIDTICVSPDSKFIIICLRNGMVHVVDFESEEKNILYSQSLGQTTDGKPCYVNCFVQEVVENSTHFLIVTCKGVLYSLILTNDVEINVFVEEKLKFGHQVNIAAYSYPNLMVNGAEMTVLDVEENSVINDESPVLKKIFPVGRKFLGLTHEGKLLHICSSTLLTFNIELDFYFKDISVISVGNKHNILAITEKENCQYIELFSYKEFDTIFSIKVNNDVILLKEESLIEETIFLSKIILNGTLNEIRFCTVNETEPELRLERLVRKQKFEEAEKFAQTFKLDPIIINKAKVENIINERCDSQEIDKLLELMNKIDDIQFKLMVCDAADSYCNHLNDIRRILVYGATLPLTNADELIDKQKIIISLLYKFDTYLSLNSPNSVQDWLKFSESDIIEVLQLKLQQHELKDAIKIYSRMGENLTSKLTDVELKDILTILNRFSVNDYKLFLPIFISITFSYQPTALPIFIKWIIDKIHYLERDDNMQFPENAIVFIEIILHQLKMDTRNVRSKTESNLLNYDCENTLSKYITCLKDLQTLKNNYCININLRDYSSKPKNVVGILLKIPVCSEDYEQFLNGFLLNYMTKNRLDHNEILLNEIQCLVRSDESRWKNLVALILKCITSIKFKLIAVKIILEKANAPWCDNIRKIALSVLDYDHHLVHEIKTIIESEPSYVVLRRPEYKFTEWHFQSRNLECIIHRIMDVNGPTAIEDSYTFCNNDEDRRFVIDIVINRLIENGKYDDALTVLNNNNSKTIYRCSNTLIRMAALHIEKKTKQSHHYYNIIGSLFNAYQTHKPPNLFSIIDGDLLHIIRSVYNIHNSNFNHRVKINDLMNNKQKKQIYNTLLNDIVNNFTITQDILTCISDCKKIATYLCYKEEQVLVDFCHMIENFKNILSVAQYLYDNNADSRTLCTMALLLLKYANANNINEQTFDETFNFDEVNDTSTDNSLELALKLVHKGLVKASVYDFTACMEVMNWMEVCVTSNGIIQSSTPNRIQEISESVGLHTVRRIFQTYCCFVDQFKHQNLLYLTPFRNSDIKITEDDLLREIKVLPNTVDTLCKDGQHVMAYKLIFTIQNSIQTYGKLDKNKFNTVNSLVIKQCIPHLLHFVIIQNDIDQTMLFTLLLLCGETDAIKYISQFLRMCKRQPNKLYSLSQVALKIWDYYNVQHINKESLITSILNVKWWKRIQFCKISYETFFKSTSTVRLEMMIKFCYIDEFSLEEYCKDFNLDVQQFYKVYLKYTLINYKPEYDVITDVTGKKRLTFKDTENTLSNKCLTIIKFVKNEDSVLTILDEIWNKLNCYYYETFQCILKIRKDINKKIEQNKNWQMLNFLKSYRRLSPPSQMESEQWYTIFPDEHAIEPLSEFRLPFTPILFTSEIWNIIRPEINLKSYKFWINMCDLLKPHLNVNDICAIAVKNVTESGILNNVQIDEWGVIGKHEDLFLEIDACLKHMDNLEVCTSAIYYVMTHAPRGADQVDAAALCYQYALDYKNKFPDDEAIEKAFKKVKNKYLNISATHALYTNQLNDECYLELVNKPEDLIHALYMDKRILKKINTVVDQFCPDINVAVDAIAVIFNLDTFEIRKNLLISLLSNSTVEVDLNSTLLMLQCIQQTNKSDCDDDNLKRAAYICTSGCGTKYWPEELLKLAEQCNESAKNCFLKARIFKCFCMISNKATIKDLTGLEFDAFLNYIDKLLLLSELEYFGFEMDVTKLDEYNKKGLLKRLAKQAGDKVKSINLMAAVCMTYNIYELKYWEFIINSAISLKMFKELKIYMEFIKDCHYKPFSVNAWQVIIDNALSFNITGAKREEIVELMVENYLMIQSCPVLYSLDFETIIKKLIEIRHSTFAAVLLQYLAENKRALYVEEIKKSCDPELLRCLSERGVCDLIDLNIF